MRPNAWVGLVAIILGIVYSFQAYNLPHASIGNPMAPLYFPLGLGTLMTFLGALIFFIEWKKGLNSDDKSKRPRFHFQSMKLILITIGLCLLYTVMFDYAGFVFSTILFLIIMLAFVNSGKEKFKKNVIIAVCFSFGMWFIFVRIFQITLPSSPLGIF